MGNSLKKQKGLSDDEDLKEKNKRHFLPALEIDTDFKLYLVGSQLSGKSTFYEQLENTIQEYTEEQKKEKIIHIQRFIISNIICLHDEPIDFQTKESKEYFEHISKFYESQDIIEEGYEKKHHKIIKLFEESNIFEVLKQKDIVTYHEKASLHFFKNMYRLDPEVYIPTLEDVIHSQKYNSQYAKIMDYEFKNNTYRLIDQSGHPNIRYHYRFFDQNYNKKNHRRNITPLFIMSSTDYFQMMTICPQNRLIDSLGYLDLIVDGRYYFKESDKIILILSKFDLFLKYYKKNDLSKLFDEYKGGHDIKNMMDFIVNEFKKRTPKDIKLSVLIGDLTDSDQFNILIEDVENIVNGSLVIEDYRVYKTKEKFYFDESDIFQILKKKFNRYSQCLNFHKLEDINYLFR